MARLHKPKKKRSKLERIRHEKFEIAKIIYRAEAGRTCPEEKMNKFLARWHALCNEELRAMVEASKVRKAAAA